MERQLIVFLLGKEYYGVGISFVREIVKSSDVTRIPGTADFIEGIMNLRGYIVPVLNPYRWLNLNGCFKESDGKRIIVVHVEGQTFGLLVDQVSEILRVKEEDIEKTPDIAKKAETTSESVEGVAKIKDRLIILLNLEKAINAQITDISDMMDQKDITFSTPSSEKKSRTRKTA